MFSLNSNGSHLCKLITIDDSYSFIKYYCIISGSDVINVSSVSTTNKVYCMISMSLHERLQTQPRSGKSQASPQGRIHAIPRWPPPLLMPPLGCLYHWLSGRTRIRHKNTWNYSHNNTEELLNFQWGKKRFFKSH